ncbi:MAG: diaminopimelate epimerase [Elusimicrobiota bacterium]
MPFSKLSGAGNDFILFADPPPHIQWRRLAPILCRRRIGIGADGILILRRAAAGLPSVSYFNADGSRAFCGNGSRCAAWWMHKRGWTRARRFSFRTDFGILAAEITGSRSAAILMPEPSIPELNINIKIAGRNRLGHRIDTGAPHLVIETDNLEVANVEKDGALLRKHKSWAPEGVNVDFVRFQKNGIAMRTYEKGVEAETLSCGTGAVAAACVALALGRARGQKIAARTANGGTLFVRFKSRAKNSQTVWLEGPVSPAFEGEISL